MPIIRTTIIHILKREKLKPSTNMSSTPIQVVPDANGNIAITIKLIIANTNTNVGIPAVASTGNITTVRNPTTNSIQTYPRSQNL